MIGGPLFYDFARVGANTRAFQSFVLSAGVVTDYVYGAGMHWQGGSGGFPCDGSGSLNQWNVIGELKATTPLSAPSASWGARPRRAAVSPAVRPPTLTLWPALSQDDLQSRSGTTPFPPEASASSGQTDHWNPSGGF
jgi:hypothetical protein